MNGFSKGRRKEIQSILLMLNVKKGEARAEKIHSLRGLDFDKRGRKDIVSSTSLRTCTQRNNMTLQAWRTQNFQGVNRYKPHHMKRIKEGSSTLRCQARGQIDKRVYP
jgi:hypothetical protein